MQRQAIDAIALGDMTVVGVDTLKGGLGTEQYFIWTFNTLVSGYKLLKLSSTTSRLIVQPLAAKMVVISYAQSIRLRQRVAIALIQNPLNAGTDIVGLMAILLVLDTWGSRRTLLALAQR